MKGAVIATTDYQRGPATEGLEFFAVPLLPEREKARELLGQLTPEDRERFVDELLDAQWKADADRDPDHVSLVIQRWVVGMMFLTDPNREALERRADRILAEARAREAAKRRSASEGP